MNKIILKKIVALFFALYLPLTMVGLPLHKHYCKGNLEKMQLLVQPPSCHEEAKEDTSCCSSDSSCHSEPENEQSHEEDDCCNNEMDVLKTDYDLISHHLNVKSDLDLKHIVFVSTLLPKKLNSFETQKNQSEFFYPPPKIPSLILMTQRFLC